MTSTAFSRPRQFAPHLAATLAVALGHVIGWSRPPLRLLPGLAGAALVSYGAALVYLPAGVIAGGVFLLAMDRQITLRSRRPGE